MSEGDRILVVEDDAAIATGLALNLKLEGYLVDVVGDGEQALAAVAERRPALMLLDLSLPRKDGLTVLSELRAGGDALPVVVLSAREGEYDKVGALRIGADDYVTKPFAVAELMARIAAVLRRARLRGTTVVPVDAPEVAPSSPDRLGFGDIEIDLATRTVTRGGDEIKLTHLELELLVYLVKNPARVLPRDLLLREVWGLKAAGSPRTVDNFVLQLRAKLEADPDQPRYIVTVRGSGYRFDP
jgi:two-component system alkaline phosphatase synthesis response regulator PhoP